MRGARLSRVCSWSIFFLKKKNKTRGETRILISKFPKLRKAGSCEKHIWSQLKKKKTRFFLYRRLCEFGVNTKNVSIGFCPQFTAAEQISRPRSGGAGLGIPVRTLSERHLEGGSGDSGTEQAVESRRRFGVCDWRTFFRRRNEDGNEEPLRVCLYPFWDESGAQPNCSLIWERECVLIKDFTPTLGRTSLCPAEKLEREGPPLRPHWNSFSFFMWNIFILHVSFKSIQEPLAMIIKVFFKKKKILHLKVSFLIFFKRHCIHI